MLLALPASVTPWVATVAWSFAGFGMGLAISGTSVLLFGVLHQTTSAAGTFVPIYVVMALLAVAGIALAGRLRPDTVD